MARGRPSRHDRTSLPPQQQQSEKIEADEVAAVQEAAEADTPSQVKRPVASGPAPVVIDLGAYTVRIGIGNTLTRCPNAIVRQVQRRGTTAAAVVGSHIHAQCTNFGSLSIRQPMDRGLVVDWAAQKIILDAALTQALTFEGKGAAHGQSSRDSRLLEGRTVLLTEAYLNLPDLQAAMDLLLLEEYGAACIWRCVPALVIPYAPSLFAQKPSPGPGRKRSRPECALIVDLGHGASHVVPVIGEDVVWKAVRRHVISQRIITNLLKECISFRQWDMMDESWLINHVKERSCFVAARSGRRGDGVDRSAQSPSDWSYAALLELCQGTSKKRNPIVQEYVLPDYASSSAASKYGYVRHGPSAEATESLDSFIADSSPVQNGHGGSTEEKEDDEEEEGEEESDDDFDGEDGLSAGSSAEEGSRPKKKVKKAKARTIVKQKPARDAGDDDESEQVLILERERFQVPEAMFDTAIAGLDDAGLHEVILASIEACDEDVQGMMWANIVLVGGGAQMRGMKRRLEWELRAMAPIDMPVHIFSSREPSMTAVEGMKALASAPSGSSPGKVVDDRLLSSKTYNSSTASATFGSWNGSQ